MAGPGSLQGTGCRGAGAATCRGCREPRSSLPLPVRPLVQGLPCDRVPRNQGHAHPGLQWCPQRWFSRGLARWQAPFPLAPGGPRAPTSAAAARAAPAGAWAAGGLLCGERRDPLGLVHRHLPGLLGPRPLGVDLEGRCVGAAAAAGREERAETQGTLVWPCVVPAAGRLRVLVAIPRVADVGLPVALLLCAGRGSGRENSAGSPGVQPAARPCEPRPPRRCGGGEGGATREQGPRVRRHRPQPRRKLSPGLVVSAPGLSRLSLSARTGAPRMLARRACGRGGDGTHLPPPRAAAAAGAPAAGPGATGGWYGAGAAGGGSARRSPCGTQASGPRAARVARARTSCPEQRGVRGVTSRGNQAAASPGLVLGGSLPVSVSLSVFAWSRVGG